MLLMVSETHSMEFAWPKMTIKYFELEKETEKNERKQNVVFLCIMYNDRV